jgi:tetratricopeptide (TPR) repeat protein
MKTAVFSKLFLWLLFSSVAMTMTGCVTTPPDGGLDAEGIATNNRGVASMGRFDFQAAYEAFTELAGRYPDNVEVQVNLAIAIMNRQGDGDEGTAKAIFDRVLAADRSHLRAAYGSGIIDLHQGNAEAALPHFLQVTDADPRDAAALYHVGQCHMQLQHFAKALPWFERAIQIDPYFRSAYYRAFQASQRLRDRERAEAFLERFQALEANPRSHLVEFKYTKMGPLAEVVALGAIDSEPIEMPSGPVFAEPLSVAGGVATWRTGAAADPAPNVTVCDLDHDGAVDLFYAGAIGGQGPARNAVLMAGDEGFELAPDHPLAKIEKVNTALWGDIDNDGLTDVYLCRRGPNQLWRQTEGGLWQDLTIATGTGGGELDTIDGAMFDADHDGDLDIFVINSDGHNELFNNNRDGTFRPLAAASGLAGNGDSRGLLVTDLDADLDGDLIVINREPPHEVHINELLWEYSGGEGWDAFVSADIVAAVSGDVDADGRIEIYTVDEAGALNRWQVQGGAWTANPILGSEKPGAGRLALADIDGDGQLDLVMSAQKEWRVISPTDGGELYSAVEPLTTWTLAALDPSLGLSLVALTPDSGPSVWHPGPGRLPFATVSLTGRDDEAGGMRTNASGIGTRLAVRVGARWTVVDTYRVDSGPGQSLQPLLLGVGGAPLIDFVSIDWSDGVLQTEMDLVSGEVYTIAETQRQISSCPVLFSWDGESYRFVSDLLGVGGIGYALGPGEYNVSRPWERLMLPPDALAPRNGRLVLKLGEPMEEIAYLDAARLVAYDLPPGWLMTVDDRMSILGPEPTGEPVFARRTATPVRAVNDRGDEVTDTIMSTDLRAAPVGNLDLRFIGRLESEHRLTLVFDQDLDRLGETLVLIADGWVEYPYSQTNFAAWQAGADYRAPSLEARGADGTWTLLYEQFGYPAGMPRQMSLPLPALPPGTRELRLTTNQEVYLDRVVVAAAEKSPEVRRQELRLTAARVEQPGFALRTTGPQRLPAYDWARRAPLWDTRFQVGYYTRFGDALELVAATDDAVAIFGPGEAVHLEYETPPDDLRPGWSRVYVLEVDGWCKDMDRFTKDGATVAPLPSAGKDPSIPERLHEKYNTRYVTSSG